VTLIENWEATIQGPQIYHFLPTIALPMNLLGSLFGGGESHEQVTVIWDIRNPSHLLCARQGQALHGWMPAGVHDDLRIVGGFACASAHEFECVAVLFSGVFRDQGHHPGKMFKISKKKIQKVFVKRFLSKKISKIFCR